MNHTRAISVIMPVYNGAVHLTESIDSILAQTFTDFEFIIVNDGSTDASLQILQAYAVRDSRIKIINNPTNQKIAKSLNTGINAARSPLIARMDADDWAHPTRLEKQYKFMQKHPEIDVCGSALNIYSTGETWLPPTENQHIRSELLFNSCIYHPTVMFKKDKILNYCQGYAEGTQPAEDYDLWTRLSLHRDVVFANISDPLLRYRTYPAESRVSYRVKQKNSANMVRLRLLQSLLPEVSQENFTNHLILSETADPPSPEDLHTCGEWAKALLTANTHTCVHEHKILSEVVTRRWLTICGKVSRHSLIACYTYYKAGLYTDKNSVLLRCSIMMMHTFIAKIFPLSTRRREFVKHILAKCKIISLSS